MAPPHLFKKSKVQVFEPLASSSRTQRHNPSKSCSSFFSKSLVVLLVLVIIPLFPSQAPDFVNQWILTKFWELFHLLFIGIVVSYGLFSRRSVKMEIENHSGPYNTSNLPYLSGISNVSSFFEDGFQNVCFSDEKKMMHTLDPLFKGSSASDEGKKIRSFSLRNEFENTSEANGENGNRSLNSLYFPGESLVVVTGGNHTLEKHKPLGLPIRSLRSRIPGGEKLQFAYSSSNGPNSSLKICSNHENEESVEKIRGMTPTNLGNKFEEVSGHSSIPWKSRSVKMEMREEEDVGNGESPPAHSRPYNVVEFEFMPQHNSRSSSSRCSSSSSSKSSPVSPELSDMKTGSLGHKIDLNSSVEVKGFSGGSCCSCSSSLELDMQKVSEEDMKKGGIRRNGKEHLFSRGKPSSSEPVSPDAANNNNKPSNISKILSRAKSVRTFRSGKYVMEKMKRKDEVRTADDQSAAATTINPKDFSPPQADIQKQNCDKDHHHHSLMRRRSPVFPEKYQNRENQRPVDSDLVAYEEEEDSESSSSSSPCESCNDQNSSSSDENENGNLSAEVDKEEDLAGSEVDRKADEFIAKFREQIRLQKIGSVRKQCS